MNRMDRMIGYYAFFFDDIIQIVEGHIMQSEQRIAQVAAALRRYRRGFNRGSIRLPEGSFALQIGRSVPVISITYEL